MKQGAIVRCYHLTEYLQPVLKAFKDIDGVIVMNHRFKDVPESSDDTLEKVKELNQFNVTINQAEGKEQQEVFNQALEIFEYLKFDWVWINDADEFIEKKDRDTILSYLSSHPFNGGTTNVIDYVKQDEICEIRTHRPTVIVKPFVRFRETRCADYSNYYFKDIYMHHFGHMMEDKEWKENNLWYPKHSYDNVICTRHQKYKMPKEIKELTNG